MFAIPPQFRPSNNDDLNISDEEQSKFDDLHFDLNHRYSGKDMERVFVKHNQSLSTYVE